MDDSMEQALINRLKLEYCIYVPIKNSQTLQNIYNLYCFDTINYQNPQKDPQVDLYYGLYYYFKKDYTEMKKYYEFAMDGNEANAFFNLGFYYRAIEGNVTMMEKYYMIASKKGHAIAMNSLGLYYKDLKMYDRASKYYLMAIDHGNKEAVINYEVLCKIRGETCNLIDLYIKINNNYNLVWIYRKYLKEAGQLDMKLLKKISYVESNMNYISVIKRMLNKKISLLKAHFEYSIGSSGFMEAKKDFEKIVNHNIFA